MYPANAYTVCIVGAEVQVVERIDAILKSAPDQLQARWQPAGHADAQLLIIDTESLYGHMDWLKTRSSRRLAVAYTDGPDAFDSDFVLRKPIDADALITTLNRVGARLRNDAPAKEIPIAVPDLDEQRTSAREPMPFAELAEPSRASTLAGLLRSVTRPTRLAGNGLPSVFIDPRAQAWHCADGLKAIGGWCHRSLNPAEIRPLGDADFAAAVGHLPGHPYSRLLWIAELMQHAGALAPDLDSLARYRLSRWPQSEREFPRHFRIATLMLKQAASPQEIAAHSGATTEDVNDFINAYHAIGFIEHTAAAPRQPEPSRGGLFARLRKASAN